KAARIGLRVQDLLDMKIFAQKLEVNLKEKNALLSKVYNQLPLDAKKIIAEYEGYAERLAPYIADTSLAIHRALQAGQSVLLDGVLLRYAARLNSLTDVFLTKFDKLSGVGQLKIATAYTYEGDVYDEFPPHQTIFHKCEPVYEKLDGWDEDISGARAYADLPA